jgi:20S proteasome alpha/beta subunit
MKADCARCAFMRISSLLLYLAFEIIFQRGQSDAALQYYVPDGTVNQLTYAARAVAKSPLSFGFIDKGSNSSVLFALRRRGSALRLSVPKIDSVDSISFLLTGYEPDCVYVRSKIIRLIEEHRFRFGELISLPHLRSQIEDWMSDQLTPGRENSLARPLAFAALFTSLDHKDMHNGHPNLLCVTNSGDSAFCRFTAAGKFNTLQSSKLRKNCLSRRPLGKKLIFASRLISRLEPNCDVECTILNQFSGLVFLKGVNDITSFSQNMTV